MYVRFGWLIVLFKSFISLLIFCVIVLSIIGSGVLKSATILFNYPLVPLVSLVCVSRVWGSVSRYIYVYNFGIFANEFILLSL